MKANTESVWTGAITHETRSSQTARKRQEETRREVQYRAAANPSIHVQVHPRLSASPLTVPTAPIGLDMLSLR